MVWQVYSIAYGLLSQLEIHMLQYSTYHEQPALLSAAHQLTAVQTHTASIAVATKIQHMCMPKAVRQKLTCHVPWLYGMR